MMNQEKMSQEIEIKATEERIDLLGETADVLPKPSYWLCTRSIDGEIRRLRKHEESAVLEKAQNLEKAQSKLHDVISSICLDYITEGRKG